MLMFKSAVVLVVSSYLGITAGQSRDQHNNISLNEGLELDFQGTELMVSQDRHSENSIRITRDFDLFIGDDKVQLTLAQKGLVGQFYDAASELDSIVDDLKINGLDFDAAGRPISPVMLRSGSSQWSGLSMCRNSLFPTMAAR